MKNYREIMASYLTKPRLPLGELRKKLKALKRLDLRRADLDSLKKELAPILHHYVHPSPLMQLGERIFRAVQCSERPTLNRQLTYPPAQKVKTYGRVNRPGEPIFYGSVGSTAAIQELAPADGARLAVSMWRVTKAIPVVSVGYSERAFARLGSNRWSQVWWRRQHPLEPEPAWAEMPENIFLDKFLAKEFTKLVSKRDDWKYKLSVAISESYLKAQPVSADDAFGPGIPGFCAGESITGIEAGGLVYPSIATGANDDNVALKCAIADTCLELVWAHYIEISRPTNKADEFTPKGLDFANQFSSSGEIQWIGGFPNVLVPGTDLRLDTVGSVLVLKDSLNRVIGRFPEGGSAISSTSPAARS